MSEDYEENEFPLAYLITFRTYGTWLHGDERTSVSRQLKGIIDINVPLKERMKEEMTGKLSFWILTKGKSFKTVSKRCVCIEITPSMQ